MREIKISDGAVNAGNIDYLYRTLSGTLADLKGEMSAERSFNRATLRLKTGREYYEYLKCETEDKIAEVIAVKYKYDYFKRHIRAEGLNPLETEFLFSALISADVDEDKNYISRKIRRFSEYNIDGVYNFRIGALKKKWADIVGYIPTYFEKGGLTDFISYLTSEKSGRAVTVENGSVYDIHYNILKRTSLIPSLEEGEITREAILSGCGEVRVRGELPETDMKYLRLYFPERITISPQNA